MTFRILVATATFIAGTSVAQAQSIAGNWDAEYPMRVRMENGQLSSDKGKAALTITQKGDSVFGSWQALNTPIPSAARTIAGLFKDGKLTFEASPTEARVSNSMTGESVIKMRSYFEATIAGDSIVGTMRSRSEDRSIESPPMPWTAKRGVAK